MLNRIWLGFFVVAFVWCAGMALLGHPEVFARTVESSFKAAHTAVDIAIGLIGVLCFWMGLFEVGEKAGLIEKLAWLLAPLFRRLMPEVPQGHPALGAVTMNLAANMLGLDNAATPMGLKAMRELQTLNRTPDTASNPQILFLVLNSSAVTLIPVTIFLYRAQMGAANPAAVFLPILLATSASAFTGLLSVALIQRLPVWDRVVLAYVGGFATFMALLLSFLVHQPAAELTAQSALVGNVLLMSIIMLFLVAGWRRGVPVYDTFVTGAKQGFGVATGLIPFLVAMLVAVAMFRACGAMDFFLQGIGHAVAALGLNTDFVPALTTALMKPLSGSGARAMMLETMQTYGVDSFAGRTAAVIQGSSETTFYVLAVYFGAVGIRKERYALACGLLADFAGATVAILASYWFFHADKLLLPAP